MTVKPLAYAALLAFVSSCSGADAQTPLILESQGTFCNVEVRAGNNGNPTSNPVDMRAG